MRRRYHIHLPGVVYVCLTLLVGVAAANRPNNLLVWVFGAMLAGVLVSGVVSGGMLMGVRATRLDPRRGTVGEPLVIRYALVNRSRFWPAFNLQIAERPVEGPPLTAGSSATGGGTPWQEAVAAETVASEGWVMHVGAGDTAHGEEVLVPTRRGRLVFDGFRVSTTFPFGFLRKSVSFRQRSDTLVYPRLLPLRPDLLSRLVQGGLGGFRLSAKSGPGEDYFGLREYRPGDSIRQIAWKRVASGAGSGVGSGLVSIERSSASPPRLRVVLNLRVPTAELRANADGRKLEEEAISLAASLLSLGDALGHEVGLTVLGIPAQRSPLRRGRWHVEKLMAILAAIDLDAERLRTDHLPESDREHASVVVVHPDRAAPAIAPPDAFHVTATQLESFLEPSVAKAGAAAATIGSGS